MQNTIEISKLNRTNKNLDLDYRKDLDLIKNRTEFTNIIGKAIDKGANYVIKAMPINAHIKDILIDVKNAFKTKDFEEILNTAVNSSVREGLEILSLPKSTLKDITKIKDIAVQGGLKEGLSAGIEIISNKCLGKNAYDIYIKDFFNKVGSFVKSKNFSEKLDSGLDKCVNKINSFKDACKDWYNAYDEFDIDLINDIAKNLNKKKNNVEFNEECVNQNNVIQNMTKFINNKKDKLSDMQMQICNSL